MVSRAEVEDYVRQGKTEAEGYTDIQFENLQKIMNGELQQNNDGSRGHRQRWRRS